MDTMEINEIGHGLTTETTLDGCYAVVKRHGKLVKRYRGETAHSDAHRLAMDLWSDIAYGQD